MKLPRVGRLEKFNPEYKTQEKYSLDFDWGTFHVTASADEALGLVPLVSTQNKPAEGSPFSPEALGFRTDIWLAGPGEIASDFEGLPVLGGRTITTVTPAGIESSKCFNQTDRQVLESFLEELG